MDSERAPLLNFSKMSLIVNAPGPYLENWKLIKIMRNSVNNDISFDI